MSPATLSATLRQADSATAVLEAAVGAPVTVRRLSPDGPHDDPVPAFLIAAEDGEAVLRRHVELVCGDLAVSQAELWYIATRLPADLAARLTATGDPFGRVVAGLGLRRKTLSARLCDAGAPCALEHRAVLVDPGGRVIALVHERYSWALFGCS